MEKQPNIEEIRAAWEAWEIEELKKLRAAKTTWVGKYEVDMMLAIDKDLRRTQ